MTPPATGAPPLLTTIENATRVVLMCLIGYMVAGWLRPAVVDVWQWTRQHTSPRARAVEPRMTGPVPPSSVAAPH